jgi:hypothetical protein
MDFYNVIGGSGIGTVTGNKVKIRPKTKYHDDAMMNVKNSFQNAFKILHSPAKTKISKSELDRGGGGVFTNRRNRFDLVNVTFISFVENHHSNPVNLDTIYLAGWRILCNPDEYFSNQELLNALPLIVRYENYDELKMYPAPIEWDKISSNRHDYKKEDIMWVQDIKNLDKFRNKGNSVYIGPTLIGQNEMDYATKSEIENVKFVMLYQMIKMEDFKQFFSASDIDIFTKFQNDFEKSKLFLENDRLQEYSVRYGKTVCPELIKFGDVELASIKFKDIINGTIEGDIGREKFNRTATKINLHHIDRLLPGKLNHNHKNVFLGKAEGNSINAAFNSLGFDLELVLKKCHAEKDAKIAELEAKNAELQARVAVNNSLDI